MINKIKGKLKSKELEDGICSLIVKNRLQKDDPILSESKLTDVFGVSRVTVRQAIANLVDKDILYTVKGKGTFVSINSSLVADEPPANFQKTIAMLVSSISNSYFSNLAKGIEDACKLEGYNVMFSSTSSNPELEEKYIREFLDHNVDGMILAPSESAPLTPYVAQLCRETKKLVIVNEVLPGYDVNNVSSDDCEGAYLATKHLLELGHRKIAHLRGAHNVANANDRMAGYIKALKEYGIESDNQLINGIKLFDREGAKLNTLALLELPQEKRPTAIFAYSDITAAVAYNTIKEKGLRVPEDISLVGYGDLLETARMGIELTSVRQNGYDIGKTACEILLDSIQRDSPSKKVLLAPKLIIRKSCAELNK